MLKLPPMWLNRWQTPDPFWHVFHLQGEIYREQPGRKTLRFIEDNEPYFVKMHFGVGWREIIKNFFSLRLPVIGAKNELRAIERLEKFNFTPTVVGYGWRGKNPAEQESFIITKELGYTISLEDFCRDWPENPPSVKLKWALINKIADLARTMHENGVNHRDFYLCHFLLDVTGGRELLNVEQLNIYIIDLHRAQVRRKTPTRWRVKDIAGLYFSAMDIGLTKRDKLRFMRRYNSHKHPFFWWRVCHRAEKLYRKIWRQLPRDIRLPFYLPLNNHQFIKAEQLFRCQPGKRLVVKAQWQKQPVVAKLFTKYRYAANEIRGSELLSTNQFKTPKLLTHSWSQFKALYIVIYEFLTEAQSFSEIYEQAPADQKPAQLSQLLALIHHQHQAKLWHNDLHLANFLYKNNEIYTIDASSIKSQSYSLSQHKRDSNIAMLFAQLPRKEDHHWSSKATPKLINIIQFCRIKRMKKQLKKLLRESTRYLCKKSAKLFLVLDREFDTQDFQHFIHHWINNIATENTKLMINGKAFTVKNYSPARWLDFLISPARRAWLAAHQNYEQNGGAKPIALFEKRRLFFYYKKSCLICLE